MNDQVHLHPLNAIGICLREMLRAILCVGQVTGVASWTVVLGSFTIAYALVIFIATSVVRAVRGFIEAVT